MLLLYRVPSPSPCPSRALIKVVESNLPRLHATSRMLRRLRSTRPTVRALCMKVLEKAELDDGGHGTERNGRSSICSVSAYGLTNAANVVPS